MNPFAAAPNSVVASSPTSSSTLAIAVGVGVAAFLLILCAVIVATVMLRRRRRRSVRRESEELTTAAISESKRSTTAYDRIDVLPGEKGTDYKAVPGEYIVSIIGAFSYSSFLLASVVPDESLNKVDDGDKAKKRESVEKSWEVDFALLNITKELGRGTRAMQSAW